MRDAFVGALLDEARRDSRVCLVTGDLGFGVLDRFARELPAQYLNAGVAEQNMTGLAAGLALTGRIVFTYSIANFPVLRCLEQIRNDAAYHDAPVKVVAIGGGFSYGALGMSHHATEDLATMRAMPTVTVLAPCTQNEAALSARALIDTPGTCYLRLDKSHGEEPDQAPLFVPGKARRLQEGTDIAILTVGGIMGEVQIAAQQLTQAGISVRVVGVHTLKPLDVEEILAAAKDTSAVLTVEEHRLEGGLGSAVAEVYMDAGVYPRRSGRMGLTGPFASAVGSQAYLRSTYGLDASAIVARALQLLG